MVFDSCGTSRSQPPNGPPFPRTPWLCMYSPVSMLAREGQQRG